ncbi:MAG: hypothetical protein HY834_09350 [Devosia nanyangense]|uniref:Uncharacterized protein n=1 Tax=Devosia nanyangense TaxID=1228055 RepID=A0A933L3T0_9HYPH|nr:hypothetical protein [Devosia nanyangense]
MTPSSTLATPQQRMIPAAVLAVALACFAVSLWAMFPGWMTTDSLSQYLDAKTGVYRDQTPVLMSWLWNKLLPLSDGPLPMLVLDLLGYWGGFALLALGARDRIGWWACLIPLVGLWPGVLEQVGFVWKDIVFGTLMFCAWAALIRRRLRRESPRLGDDILVIVACVVGFGVKPNGIAVVPFLVAYWFVLHGWLQSRWWLRAAAVVAITAMTVPAGNLLLTGSTVRSSGNMLAQYTAIYDLLGLGVRTESVLLPDYILAQRGCTLEQLRPFYYSGGMNGFFFDKKGGSLATLDLQQQQELGAKWLAAVTRLPGVYLRHRWDNLASMLRLGYLTPAWVGTPGIGDNKYGLTFTPNVLSDLLGATLTASPWMFIPWLYAALHLAAYALVMLRGSERLLATMLTLASGAFFAPHLFVLPAGDYRYLYFCYLCALAMAVVAVVDLGRRRNPAG